MSLVVDFVLLGGTNSVLVIWGLILYSVFRQILPRSLVNAFCTALFTWRYKFSYRALVNFDLFRKKSWHCDKVIRFRVICFWWRSVNAALLLRLFWKMNCLTSFEKTFVADHLRNTVKPLLSGPLRGHLRVRLSIFLSPKNFSSVRIS